MLSLQPAVRRLQARSFRITLTKRGRVFLAPTLLLASLLRRVLHLVLVLLRFPHRTSFAKRTARAIFRLHLDRRLVRVRALIVQHLQRNPSTRTRCYFARSLIHRKVVDRQLLHRRSARRRCRIARRSSGRCRFVAGRRRDQLHAQGRRRLHVLVAAEGRVRQHHLGQQILRLQIGQHGCQRRRIVVHGGLWHRRQDQLHLVRVRARLDQLHFVALTLAAIVSRVRVRRVLHAAASGLGRPRANATWRRSAPSSNR